MKILKVAIYILLFATALKLLIAFGMPQFRYHAYKSDAKEIVNLAMKDEEELRARLLEKAGEYDLPVREDQIRISGERGDFRASISWSETVNIYNYYSKTYDFSVDVGGK